MRLRCNHWLAYGSTSRGRDKSPRVTRAASVRPTTQIEKSIQTDLDADDNLFKYKTKSYENNIPSQNKLMNQYSVMIIEEKIHLIAEDWQ